MSEHENVQGLCEDCGKNDAVCTMAVMMGTKTIHRKLCQACMAKTSMALAAGNLGQVLGSILAAAQGAAQPAAAPDALRPQPAPKPQAAPALPTVEGEPESCPGCGLPYAQLRQHGRAGCARCWTAFRRTVEKGLASYAPAVQHTGRRPVDSEEARRDRAVREMLQRRLEEAIAREDYESAAQLRDAMREIDRQEGAK
ncbi:MAG: UvrB/UvrC motif-containing protein [Clostridia bacterium]|nr:UvrB/UvrC motif-containing protein [Clostridia bacterium]